MRARVLVCLLALLTVCAASAAAHETDSARPRYYLHLRGQDSNPVTETHDHWGLSLGADLGRHWGLELSVDTLERRIQSQGDTLGEYGIVALVPQLRLRYPVLRDRLVPYVVGGAGVAFTDLNDVKVRTPPRTRVDIDGASDSFPVGTVGAGLEYYFADNLAAGVEVKYLAAGDRTLSLDGAPHSQQVASLLTTVGLRLLVPERDPRAAAEAAEAAARVYFGIRFGTAVSTDTDAFANVEIRPEPPAYFSTGNQLFGAALGVDIGRYLGLEVAFDGYEVVLATPQIGSVTEMAVAHFIPHARVRYPLLDDRLVPYLIGGVGVGYTELNDRKQRAAGVPVDSTTWGLAAAAGAGVEYLVASNIAVGLEGRWLTSRGHTVRVGDSEGRGHYDAVAVALTLRVYLAGLGR